MNDSDTAIAKYESAFRAGVPAAIGDVIVLEVSRWRPAAGPSYAYAQAVGYRTDTAFGAFSTHTVIYAHERDHWYLERGHYDLPTRHAAQQDVMTR